MKRCWFGGALLALMLIGGFLVTRSMTKTHSAVSSRLQAASDAAARENWDDAAEQIAAASGEWQKNWHFSAAFADHEPMEEIDSLFAQLDVYLKTRQPEALSAVCAQLSRMVEAMGDAHQFTWWNLL